MAQDITSLEELALLNQAGAVVKYRFPNSHTWRYTKLWGYRLTEFSDGSMGYQSNVEVSPDGVHSNRGLADCDFASDMIVQITTPEEVAGKKWSYDR